ncbi:acyltransferase family protein [Rhodococcoides fascians]|uniref:acyltransferase family protein n=1 Tax=Rhodococcoides fascians TaxID=1828 RepID=UPI0009B8A3FC|nr:acyltransferase [Rhodococcus fascians]
MTDFPRTQARRSAPKDTAIESLRGLAVVLMVAGHVIGSGANRGMQVADDSVWRLFYLGLADIRMPLFTVLSGLVYGLRPITRRGDYSGLVRGKIRRLILPLLTVGALLVVLQMAVPAANSERAPSEAWKVWVYGEEHLWFLEAVFLIFLTVAALDYFAVLSTRYGWAACTACALVAFVVVRLPDSLDFFSINGYIRLLPFFLIGYGMQRFGLFTVTRWRAVAAVGLFAAVYALRLTTILGSWELPELVQRVASLAVGVLGVTLIYSARRVIEQRPLAWLGAFSFGIYLLHVFGAAATRIALGQAGVQQDVIIFVVCLAAGVGLPVIFQKIFGAWNPVRVLVLGETPLRDQ